MSTEAIQAGSPPAARAAKTVAKTADFKGALTRAQAPFAVPVRALAAARIPEAARATPAPALPPRSPDAASRSPDAASRIPAAPFRSPAAASRNPDAAFRSRIAALESGGAGWAARNASSGALGRYQLMPVALRDIGWQDAAGGWTERARAAGVGSEADFLGSPAAQEAAMGGYLARAARQLAANGALGAAGRTVTASDGQPLAVTEAGLVAAAHRRGAGAVARWLEHRTRSPEAPVPEASRAAFANVEQRLRDFAGLSYATRAAPGAPAA